MVRTSIIGAGIFAVVFARFLICCDSFLLKTMLLYHVSVICVSFWALFCVA